ncbi:hypothetical protein EPD62_016105 [Acetivibrio thermocellus]|uniref:hypothetical protein n=1 Tax=Acetivibrio thermocellus TaxID=1515 RepID=UPI001F1F331E|nr:hypothetical protein [Acetivibrio thermocellus]
MSDKIVPNKVIYWTYTKENWFQRVKFVKGEYPKWEYPVIEFLAIRNCEKCNRLHYIRNSKKHVYVIDSKKLDDINCSCKEAFAKGELEEYFSMNDFELDEINAKIRKNESYELPRKVRFCSECKRIFVQKGDVLKIYCLEELKELT